MPTTKPLKGVNIDVLRHKKAQAIATELTEQKKIRTQGLQADPTDVTIRDVVLLAIDRFADELGIHIAE